MNEYDSIASGSVEGKIIIADHEMFLVYSSNVKRSY